MVSRPMAKRRRPGQQAATFSGAHHRKVSANRTSQAVQGFIWGLSINKKIEINTLSGVFIRIILKGDAS